MFQLIKERKIAVDSRKTRPLLNKYILYHKINWSNLTNSNKDIQTRLLGLEGKISIEEEKLGNCFWFFVNLHITLSSNWVIFKSMSCFLFKQRWRRGNRLKQFKQSNIIKSRNVMILSIKLYTERDWLFVQLEIETSNFQRSSKV